MDEVLRASAQVAAAVARDLQEAGQRCARPVNVVKCSKYENRVNHPVLRRMLFRPQNLSGSVIMRELTV